MKLSKYGICVCVDEYAVQNDRNGLSVTAFRADFEFSKGCVVNNMITHAMRLEFKRAYWFGHSGGV